MPCQARSRCTWNEICFIPVVFRVNLLPAFLPPVSDKQVRDRGGKGDGEEKRREKGRRRGKGKGGKERGRRGVKGRGGRKVPCLCSVGRWMLHPLGKIRVSGLFSVLLLGSVIDLDANCTSRKLCSRHWNAPAASSHPARLLQDSILCPANLVPAG